MNTELNGLRNIIGTAAHLHSIEEPPEREDFDSFAEFDAAHEAWWVRVHCWKVEVREP